VVTKPADDTLCSPGAKNADDAKGNKNRCNPELDQERPKPSQINQHSSLSGQALRDLYYPSNILKNGRWVVKNCFVEGFQITVKQVWGASGTRRSLFLREESNLPSLQRPAGLS
jgi:hypothetical protein